MATINRYEEETETNPDTGETSQMLKMVAVRGEKTGAEEEFFSCSVCGFYFPRSKLTKVAGKWYCTKYGCINDTRGGGSR